MSIRGGEMSGLIFNPLEAFENEYKNAHMRNTEQFFENIVRQSGVDVEENRATIRQYDAHNENLKKLKKKFNWLRFLRVLMCISLVLIPLVILKMTPKIKALRTEIENADQQAEAMMSKAKKQMHALNACFTEKDALDIMETTIPMISFDRCFSLEQEMNMKINYDFQDNNEKNQSTIGVLAGKYNENPFLFEHKIIQTMSMETYRGYKTISWTERYRDADGKWKTRLQTQTLEATVTKPKPVYNKQLVLHYGSQAGPDLSFSRDATHLDQKSEKGIERYVKRGEKKLQKKTEKSISKNGNFMSMSNSQFEVLFDALDRTNEVQFRTLFTPLAQTNMVELILSKDGYGDDFDFVKTKRANRIFSKHSQGRAIKLVPEDYTSYSYDQIKENFIDKNRDYFKAVYFDFAPLLAIPVYQERPSPSLEPIPEISRTYTFREYEVLANAVEDKYIVHPNSKTRAILKASFVGSKEGVDEMRITAYSYKTVKRIDHVTVRGDDGHYHDVPVEWDEYTPLEISKNFCVSSLEKAANKSVMANRDGLCMFLC